MKGQITLFVHRHPVTIWNEEGRHQGQSPNEPGLSPRGKLQAEKIGLFYRHIKLCGIWSSPLPRTKETAQIAVRLHSRPLSVFLHQGLAEMSHGAIDDRLTEEIAQKFPQEWIAWHDDTYSPEEPCFPGGESPNVVALRGVQALEEIARWAENVPTAPPKIVLVLTHGALLSFSCAKILGQPLTKAPVFQNGSKTTLNWDGNKFTFGRMDDITHLGDLAFTPSIII